MNYVEHLNIFGVEAKEIPCIKGPGAPDSSTVGAVGLLYMDTDNGDVYKCIAATDGAYTWVEFGAGTGSGENVDLTGYATEQWVQDQKYLTTESIINDLLTDVSHRPLSAAMGKQLDNSIKAAKMDIANCALKSEIPTTVSQFQNDAGYLTEVPEGYATEQHVAEEIAKAQLGGGEATTETKTRILTADDFERGLLSANAEVLDRNRAYTPEFLECTEAEPYMVTGNGTDMYRFVLYDSEYNVLFVSGQIKSNMNNTAGIVGYDLNSYDPAAVAYMRITLIPATEPTEFNIADLVSKFTISRTYTETIPAVDTSQFVMKSDLENLKTLKGKKWVVVGDSHTEKNSYATQRYYDYIAEQTGIAVTVNGIGGTGYKNGEGANNAYYQRVLNLSADTDVVTLFTSNNDLLTGAEIGTYTDTTTDTICGCINKTIDNLFSVLPTVKLGIITNVPKSSYNPMSTTEDNSEMLANAVVELCKRRGIPCLDLFHSSGLRPWDSNFKNLCYKHDPNKGHFDEDGHAFIAPRIKTLLEGIIM